MLRILLQPTTDATPTLRLEGKLLAPWLGELDRVLSEEQKRSECVSLDLSQVDFADAACVNWLRRMQRRGHAISACSGYLAALLTESQP